MTENPVSNTQSVAADNTILQDLAAKAKADRLASVSVSNLPTAVVARNFLVVGCGDGGCNIANQIRKMVPDTFFLAYNTSKAGINSIVPDAMINPDEEDGAGKDRSYSKNIFRAGLAPTLLEGVNTILHRMVNPAYILITTTVDGGTGSGVSPMIAKFLSDNIPNIPVIILGVYPKLNEDATSQKNCLDWQAEVNSIGVPYILFDNNIDKTTVETHRLVNLQAAKAISVLAGKNYGATTISSIDNQDMLMLLDTIGGRVNVYTTTQRPTVSKSLDDLLCDLAENAELFSEPAPAKARGIGLFVKGPEDFIKSTDTAIPNFRSKYCLEAYQYNHIEIADEICISIVVTGSEVPEARMRMARQRYDEIMEALKVKSIDTSDLTEGMADGLHSRRTKTAVLKTNQVDLSALDL